MPVAWNCVLAQTAAACPNSCVFAVHCLWRVTPSRSCLPVVTEPTQFCVACIGITSPLARHENGWRASIRHHSERPNIVLSGNSDLVGVAQRGPHAKKQPSCIWPERPARFVFSDVFGFRALFGRGGSGGGRGGREGMCICIVKLYYFLRVFVFLHLNFRESAPLYLCLYLWV